MRHFCDSVPCVVDVSLFEFDLNIVASYVAVSFTLFHVHDEQTIDETVI